MFVEKRTRHRGRLPPWRAQKPSSLKFSACLPVSLFSKLVSGLVTAYRPSAIVRSSALAAVMAAALIAFAPAACEESTPTVLTTGGGDLPAQTGTAYRWNFDDSQTGLKPARLATVLGEWVVEQEPGCPSSPNVLRQKGVFRRPDFPRVIVQDLTFSDLLVRVKCKPESGAVDRACGLIFRLKDSDNYYITRANALEGNVRLYWVVDGRRQQFATADLEVTANQWHTLEVDARGEHIKVSWNGRPVIDATDTTFTTGKIGLWTKADSVTSFDDLEATAH